MHTGNTNSLPATTRRCEFTPRLEWLLTANQRATLRRQLFRNVQEETEFELMRKPMSAPDAFARFGLLLGALPPAVLFSCAIHFLWLQQDVVLGWLIVLALGMNLLCAQVGWLTGRRASQYVLSLRDTNWFTALPAYALIGFYWAALTGAAGGFLFFGGGILFGTFVALPFGILGFTLFSSLFRLLERGGAISAPQFWPVAIGITFSLTAILIKLYLLFLAIYHNATQIQAL